MIDQAFICLIWKPEQELLVPVLVSGVSFYGNRFSLKQSQSHLIPKLDESAPRDVVISDLVVSLSVY